MRIDYDALLDMGVEAYNYPMFIRNFHIWKLSHLATRIVPITTKMQLPWNSVLHVLDNIQYPLTEIQDVPRIQTNPFITQERYRKFIYHATDFNYTTEKEYEKSHTTKPVNIDWMSGLYIDTPTQRRYIYRTAKLFQNLMNFRSEYKSAFRYLQSLDQIPTMRESLTIINHNPLFRVFVYGKLRFFRRLQLILGSIINTACSISEAKNQYILIPLTTTVFTKDKFLKSRTKLDLTSLKYPNNYHYLIMMHFLNFVNPDAVTSIFSLIPENYLKKITLIFTVGENAMFYNLFDLKTLNEKNKAYIRIVNQFNMLAMSGTPEIQEVLDAVPDEETEQLENSTPPDKEGDTNSKVDTVNALITETKEKIKKIVSVHTDTSLIEADSTSLNDALGSTIDISKEKNVIHRAIDNEEDDPLSMDPSPEFDNDETIPPENQEYDEDDEFSINTEELIDILVEHDKEYQASKRKRQVQVGVIQARQLSDRQMSSGTTPINTDNIEAAVITDVNGMVTNSPTVKFFTESVEEGTERSLKYLDELELEADVLIDNLDDLTPAQKERYKKLSRAYKNIQVGTKSVFEWLSTPPNANIRDKELTFLKGQVPDEDMLKSSILTLDDTYMQDNFGRDLLSVATSFMKNGVFLVDVKIEPVTTELNKLVNYTFYYEDINGKTSSVQVTLPQINKHGHLYINGTKKILKKQMVNLPIVKVSNTRVSLASAMNKTIVERNLAKANSFDTYYTTMLRKMSQQKGIRIDFSNASITVNKPIAYEYTTIAKRYRTVTITNGTRKCHFYYDYEDRLDHFCKGNAVLKSQIESFENRYHSVVFVKYGSNFGFIDINNNVNFMDAIGNIIFSKKTTTLGLIRELASEKINMKPLAEWTTLKIRDKNLPIIFVLAYQYGLISTLNYIKCRWLRIGKTDRRVIQDNNPVEERPPLPGMKKAGEALDPGGKYVPKPDDILIPFKNEYLVINRYPLIQSLIVAGLLSFETQFFDFEDMEDVSTYFTLLELKGYSTNYLKAITGFFGYFIDSMTRDKLEMMGEPTNCRDLLIRSTQLLSTEDHRQPSSMANHCIRSYERLNVIIYNEMARALEEYQINGGAGTKFTLNPYAVIQRVLTDQAMVSVEELNPIHDLKERMSVTYTGVGGRTAQSFVMKDRQYPEDGVGILSDATVDSGKVGIVAQISTDPTIVNTRGISEHKKPDELNPTQALCVTDLLMPAATNDDAKRKNFINIQLSHHIPTFEGDVCRVRTGYERVLAHRTTDSFAGIAKFDGTVTQIDKKLKMIKVKYNNGDEDVFSYADLYTGSSGLVIEQQIELNCQEGQPVKQGDVLVYNKLFFKKDIYSTQVDWKHGVVANVVLAERNTTLQDSNGISRRLGEKFKIAPIEIINVHLDNDSMVHDIISIGTEVRKGDILITYEAGDLGESLRLTAKDDETLAMIQQMNRSLAKATVSGTIVKIDALYGCPIAEMHPTLAKIVQRITTYKNAQHKFSIGTDAEYDHPLTGPLPKGERYKGIDFTDTTVVLQFYIRHEVAAGVGDKLVYDSALKSVISSTFDEPIITQSGIEVDAVFSGTGINRRIMTSPMITGTLSRVLEKLEQNVVEWWNGRKVDIPTE